MSRFSPAVWHWLRNAQPAGDRLVAKPAITDADTSMICAVDRAMQRHLLIPIADDAEEWNDRESRGLSISTRQLLVAGKPPHRYIDIECRDFAGHPILDGIAGEISEKLSAGAGDITGLVRKIIARWRRFWGQAPQNLLSREEQLGLFGELLFLHSQLIPRRWHLGSHPPLMREFRKTAPRLHLEMLPPWAPELNPVEPV